MKKVAAIIAIIISGAISTSNKPVVISMTVELLDSGWDKHFEKAEHDHIDIGKFKSLETGEILLIQFLFIKEFDSSLLKKNSKFEIGVGPYSRIEEFDKGIKINVKDKKDLKHHPIHLMVEIRELKTDK